MGRGEERVLEATVTATEIFTCAVCGETFESTWTDEEAIAEKDSFFGAVPLNACVVVCDDCFQEPTIQ